MREIKYRVYDKSEKRMLNWDEIKIDIASYLIASDNENIELMQYTGLKDCNSKEIYEGDIYGFPNNWKRWVIIFEDGKFFLEPILTDPNPREIKKGKTKGQFRATILHSLALSWTGGLLAYLGNICENPELLEEKCE